MALRPQKAFILILSLTAALVCSYILTDRYFPIDADSANSPIVWRSLQQNGFASFHDWLPTPDNWYFTVYPISFLLFILLGDDGKLPLILSTCFFVVMTSLLLSYVIYRSSKIRYAILSLFLLCLLPSYVYIYGFAAHPFSHYSTNFFGVLTFTILLININRNSLFLTSLSSIIAILSSISDPWFLATYFLPLLLTQCYFTFKKNTHPKNLVIFFISFVLTMSNFLQKILNLPIQSFNIVPYDKWVVNSKWVVIILGRSLNLFFVNSSLAYISSVFIWVIIFIYCLISCLKKEKNTRFIGLFSLLSVLGIISSFIISYASPSDISARFFVNAVCFIIVIILLSFSFKKSLFLSILLPLYFSSSIYSYHINKQSPFNAEANAYAYIQFLEKNNLTFGYGTWDMSNIVNWLSYNKIHITPLIIDENNKIRFDISRVQTMKSWLAPDNIKHSPNRQFLAIPSINIKDYLQQQNEINSKLGNCVNVLTFQDMTIFVYYKINL